MSFIPVRESVVKKRNYLFKVWEPQWCRVNLRALAEGDYHLRESGSDDVKGTGVELVETGSEC